MIALALGAALMFQRVAPVPGDRIEPFELHTLGGKSYGWKPGKATVITMVAYWCDTWKTQYQRLTKASRELSGLPFDALSVSIDGRWTELARNGSWGTLLTDPGGLWSRKLGIDRVPYTLVIDPRGAVRYASFGIVSSEDLRNAVRNAIDAPTQSGQVFLAFDDFPQPTDEDLLDVLRRLDVPATFFCICSKLSGSSSLVRRAVREGHALQVHSWSHDGAPEDLAKCANQISLYSDNPASLFRPVGTEKLLTLTGEPVDKSEVDPYDYLRPTSGEIERRVLLALRPGCVIHLHSGVRETIEALPSIVENARARGMSFAVLR